VYRNFSLRGSLESDHIFLARALSERGIDVHCFGMPNRRTAEVQGVTHHDVRAITLSRRRFGYALECASFAVRATAELRRHHGEFMIVDVSGTDAWDTDVVTAHAVVAAEETRIAARSPRDRARTKLAPLLAPRQTQSRIVQHLQFRSPRLQRVIARTAQVREDVVRLHGVSPELIDVIPYAVDGDRFARGKRGWLRNRLGLAPRTPLVGYVGRIVDQKGIGIAIGALTRVPEAHLTAFGAGDIERFRAVARAEGVTDRVHFLGHTDRPEDVYADVDVLTVPSRLDVWGIAAIEAMAAALPIVCSNTAGVSSAVKAANAGVVVTPDPDAVGAAIRALLADAALRAELGENGRIAASSYAPEVCVNAVLQTYAAALDRRAAAAAPTDRAELSRALQSILDLT
jgi:UDP-glucose:(heptosyl)LPS alpha-1,3-glucosyltransferase